MSTNIMLFLIVVIITAGVTIAMDRRSPKMPNIQTVTASSSMEDKKSKGKNIAPNFTVTDINGVSRSLSDFRGKVVILNFWASWCPPCIKEFPAFIQVANEYPSDVILLAISSDHDTPAMMRFLKKLKDLPFNMVIAQDKGGVITQRQYQTFRLPETFLIGVDGRIEKKIVGANWTYEDLIQDVHKLVPSRWDE
jgi:cytochrome c biogenesis protein CcmG/thiol:disulfide interchange protein DsbE